MSIIKAGLFAITLALFGLNPVLAHGGGSFSGGHMSMGSSHMSSFHSSPSFHSMSSFHSSPSFHSMSSFHSSPSFHSSSFGSSHSSGFGSFGFGSGSHHSFDNGFTPGSGSHHSYDNSFENHSPRLIESGQASTFHNDGSIDSINSSHHGGFLFFGHHDHQNNQALGASLSNAQINSANMPSEHHHGFLFFGHHDHNNVQTLVDPQNNALNNTQNVAMMSHHHHHHQFTNAFCAPATNPSFSITMAPPPITTPVFTGSITRYFYSTPRIRSNYGYRTNGNFGFYGSTYGGYGYYPAGGLVSLLYRLLSLFRLGGYSQPSYTGLNSTAFLGPFGPSSSINFAGTPTDDGATNFIDNYDNFNYQGGSLTPFANLMPSTADGGNLSNPDDQLATNPIPEPPPFEQVNFDYHYQGVLGSAFSHSQALPANSYHAPALLAIIFTHQFWDAQSQVADPNADGTAEVNGTVAAQN